MIDGVVFAHPLIYRLVMRLLRGDDLERTHRLVRDFLPPEGTLLDVCCADAAFADWLRDNARPQLQYRGLDINPRLIAAARRRGRNVDLADVRTAPLPDADVVVMLHSLYYFHPDCDAFFARLLDAARRRLIIAESVCHAVDRAPAPLRPLLVQMNLSSTGTGAYRFNRESFSAFCTRHRATHCLATTQAMVAVWETAGTTT